MEHKNISHAQNHRTTGASQPASVMQVIGNDSNFMPSGDEVARRAYFSYVNQGSRQGHDVQHWLEAEAQLIAERDRTRTHGFHNKT
jgi:hypothetical protein